MRLLGWQGVEFFTGAALCKRLLLQILHRPLEHIQLLDRKQEFQTEAALKQREYYAAKAERKQQEQEGSHKEDGSASSDDRHEAVDMFESREQQLPQQGPDYGSYKDRAPAESVAAAYESPTFVKLASNRCVFC